MIEAGTILAGKFRVDRILGQGGMGFVVAATHLTLDQQVAVKLLLAEHLGHAGLVERFVREARAVARLRGEHVCRVSDVGTLENGAPYIVMELLHGSDLAVVRARADHLPVATAVDYVLQACIGIAEAHTAGIVHRDLKPSNLFVSRRPDGTQLVKVLDFGIAKAVGEGSLSLTTTSAVLGSPSYMSPEQMRSSRNVDHRSDIWSIGVILYELLTGRLPFAAASVTEIAILIATEPTPPLKGMVSDDLAAVIARCLAKKPDDRYSSLAELAAALAPFGGREAQQMASGIAHIQARTNPVQQPSPSVVQQSTTLGSVALSINTKAPARRSRALVAVLGLLLAGGGLATVFLITGGIASRSSSNDRAGSAPSLLIDAAVESAVADAQIDPAAMDATIEQTVARDAGIDTAAAVDAGTVIKKTRPRPPSTPPLPHEKPDPGDHRQ